MAVLRSLDVPWRRMVSAERLRAFRELTPLLLSLAYRMLGSVADADDIVQDAFVRWQAAPDAEIRSPKAYLTTIVTRLCIDARRSARSRREQYFGAWLPEPLLEAAATSPEAAPAALAESLSAAFLVLLEALSPVERAVYLLHHVFDLEYAEIAPIVGKSEENCRQLARRAKEAISARPSRFAPTREERQRLASEFAAACRDGSLERLTQALEVRGRGRRGDSAWPDARRFTAGSSRGAPRGGRLVPSPWSTRW